ncbi:MAG: TIGR04222 domain-containing membrane protein, partial [Streptosporangiales bacterium]|nr:TIGR04222 domain-containing membrane protein [Streptosporangiales bacterium]
MGQPWGLSGPQFLWVYLAAMAIAALIPLGLSKALAREPRPRGTRRDLGPFQAAYLKGGPDRVALVALTELATSGALRVSSSQFASVSDRDAWAATQTAKVLGITAKDFPTSGTVLGGARRIAQSPGVRRLRQKLESEGLVGPAVWESVPRAVTVILVVALLGLGIARLVEGLSNGRPTGNLIGFLIVALMEGIVLVRKVPDRVVRPTARGAAALKPVPGRAAEDKKSPDASVAMTGALLGVAVSGLSAVPEDVLRHVLREALSPAARRSGGGGGSGLLGGIGGMGGGGGGG